MSDITSTQQTPDDELLESLVKQARVLATGLPGALSRLKVTAGPHSVDVEWQAGTVPAGAANGAGPAAVSAAAVAAAREPDPDAAPAAGHAVVAPLVGTLYLAGEPGSPPFVNEGDLVELGQQVAIIEAMKIMNAVEADRAGRVVKILAEDGEMVEFGQELVLIEPADGES